MLNYKTIINAVADEQITSAFRVFFQENMLTKDERIESQYSRLQRGLIKIEAIRAYLLDPKRDEAKRGVD